MEYFTAIRKYIHAVCDNLGGIDGILSEIRWGRTHTRCSHSSEVCCETNQGYELYKSIINCEHWIIYYSLKMPTRREGAQGSY